MKIPAKTFWKAVKAALPAAAKDSLHAGLTGVCFEFSARAFRAVATDNYRLSLFEAPGQYQPVSFVIARKDLEHSSATAFLRQAAKADATLEFELADNTVSAIWDGGGCFRLKRITMPFPTWALVIPPEQGSVLARCDKAGFQDALTCVRRETIRKDRRVVLRLRQDAVTLAPFPGGIERKTPARYTHPAYGVFNADYLLDAVKSLRAGDIEIRFRPSKDTDGILTPVEFRSAVSKGNVVRQLVMPCYPAVPPLPEE